MVMTCATCFIRLNAVGMVYMLCLAVMLLGNNLLIRRLWFAFVIVIATLAVIQVWRNDQDIQFEALMHLYR